jgi:hypothetical protein
MTTVAIGVACNKWQSYQWWPVLRSIEVEAAHLGARVVDVFTQAGSDVGRNRSVIARRFRASGAEWLHMIDDDVVPPVNCLAMLLTMQQPFASGVYTYKDGSDAHQFAPLMYRRVPETGRYTPVVDFSRGEMLTVDAVGLGCSLIHRAVFESILGAYNVGLRSDGAVVMVPKDTPKRERKGIKIGRPKDWESYEFLPFFLTENGRTEDYYFAELAARAGFRPVVDTLIECEHLAEYGYGMSDFRALRRGKATRRRLVLSEPVPAPTRVERGE